METWKIVLICYCAICYFFAILSFINEYTERRKYGTQRQIGLSMYMAYIFAPIYFILLLSDALFGDYIRKAKEIHEHGGVKKYREWKKLEEQKIQEEQERLEAERIESERIKAAYLAGEIQRNELPRLDGVNEFEFEEEMGLSVDYDAEVREIVYVENEYCQSLNDFFIRNKDLRLFHMYKFVYLPNFSKELSDGELIRYMSPDLPEDKRLDINMDSSYPLRFLWYPENAKNIKHGMMFFKGDCDNHGAKYTKGHYFHLNEGNDEEIIAQLDKIVREVHSHYCHAALYSTVSKNDIEEGSSDDYADEMFIWVNHDPEVAIIVKEIRDKVNALRERGMAEKLIRKLIQIEPKLSRLVITKDMRIILPDYNNMEITMEPINKAVFFLFLRHPEGIIFKHLPDYRKELAEIYQKIKPLGLNDRAIRSIEDVTNPCLNSINEKCARIRGAFISEFDENIAKHYYIEGWRGEAKKISLPRDLVIWEE
jgi:hypothetical protein